MKTLLRDVAPPYKFMRTGNDNSWRHFPADMLVLSGIPFMAIMGLDMWLSSFTGPQARIAEVLALVVASIGAGLLFWAKLPLFQAKFYFSFGPARIPSERKSFYYWGISLALIGCLVTAVLLLGFHY